MDTFGQTHIYEVQQTKKLVSYLHEAKYKKTRNIFLHTHTDIVLMLLDYLEKSGMFGLSLLERRCKTFSGAYYYTILQYHRGRQKMKTTRQIYA